MAKKLLPEAKKILRSMDSEKLMALKALHDNKTIWEKVMVLFRDVMYMDADKVLRGLGDVKGVDDAILKTSKQNFYRGRSNAFNLFMSLVINADGEMERRDKDAS